jgi:hypothetical protein
MTDKPKMTEEEQQARLAEIGLNAILNVQPDLMAAGHALTVALGTILLDQCENDAEAEKAADGIAKMLKAYFRENRSRYVAHRERELQRLEATDSTKH